MGKRILKTGGVEIVKRNTLRRALLIKLKNESGRKDIKFGTASKTASKSTEIIPMEQRAGFPVKLTKGGVHPRDWQTHRGCKIYVDFSRCWWLPDDWGQGVKTTEANGRSTGTGGGILTTFVAPDGKSFFHKHTSEKYRGKGKMTREDGWNGQVRRAKIQAQQALQLARAEGDNGGLSKDEALFKLLSPAERKCLPLKEKLYVCIISARRATQHEGIRDIFMVQSQFEEAGVCPTWYVDAGSVNDYKALGLKVVVGRKLTPARNKALADARKLGKVCVQASDDITAWEYRDGARAKERTDDAVNAAYADAKRLIISPVAAARFIVAKLRGAEKPTPKLGGVYMLGSCSRSFAGEEFSRRHFILGDFFVVEPDSTVKFDVEQSLKEDYDFTCGHISKYGSVIRCNRMTLNVKHYSNIGGACTNRDKKGKEEQRNIDILNRKWPGCFRKHPKRKNEVILSWPKSGRCEDIDDDDDDNDDDDDGMERPLPTSKRTVNRSLVRKNLLKGPKHPTQVKKATDLSSIPQDAILVRTTKAAKSSYIATRCKKVAGRTVKQALAKNFTDGSGEKRQYLLSDLTYDVKSGYLSLSRAGKKR